MSQPCDLNSTKAEFQRFLNGEESGYRQIFDRYKDVLYRYTYAVNKCNFEAEEIVQEAFIRLFKNKMHIHEYQQIYPYLFVIVKRLLITNYRKKVVHARYETYTALHWQEGTDTTQEQLDANELCTLLEEAIDSLSPKEKEVFNLNKLQGLSYQDISECTGRSKNTVKNQLISASKKVRVKLEKYYFPLIYLVLLFCWH